jgi:hypothetical protein
VKLGDYAKHVADDAYASSTVAELMVAPQHAEEGKTSLLARFAWKGG